MKSVSNLLNFYNCRYLTYLEDLKQGNPDEKIKIQQQDQMIIERGNQHEENYLNYLKEEKKLDVVDIKELSKGKSLKESYDITKEVLKDQPDVIFQAVLLDTKNQFWLGKADFIRKNPHNNSYEILDTKVSRNPKPRHVLQIAMYYQLLADTCETIDVPISEHLFLVSPASSEEHSVYLEHRYKFKDYQYYLSNIKENYLQFLRTNPADLKITPERNAMCTFCQWQNHCQNIWETQQDLNLLPSMSAGHRRLLFQDNIQNIQSLSTHKFTFASEENNYQNQLLIHEHDFIRYQNEAKVYLKSKTTNRPQSLPNYDFVENIGFMRLPKPTNSDIYLDIFYDPLQGDKRVYAFVIRYLDIQLIPTHQVFWALTLEDEKLAFQDCLNFMENHLILPSQDDKEDENNLHHKILGKIYYYSRHVAYFFKMLLERHKTHINLTETFLKHTFIDLEALVKECFYISQPSFELKDISVYVQSESIKRNGELLLMYESLLKSIDSTDDQQKLLEIKNACEQRIDLIEKIHCWILDKRPQFDVLTEVKPSLIPNSKEFEEQLNRYFHLFEHKFPILADLLDFYQREALPEKIKLIQRKSAQTIDLIRDSECLAGLKLISKKQTSDKNYYYFIYEFPIQETRVKEKAEDYRDSKTGETVGEIAKIDLEQGKVAIRSNKNLPERLNLIPSDGVHTGLLNDALYRYAGYLAQNNLNPEQELKYRAITSILRRDLPHIKQQNYGDRISYLDDITDNFERSKHLVSTISKLDYSYIVIQGAPGAGKTYIASQIINNLILRGAKIGIASNSHKAINNLLEAVENRATELLDSGKISEIKIKGCKLSRQKNEETHLKGKIIRDVFDNKDIVNYINHYNLIAGTAWLFSRPKFDQQIDFLFVDEAGQVSLANLIAMGTSAKNIILLGDQMQLSQPIQGDHPNESGMSALEYLLENEAVIANTKGFFLGTTFRMHPKITQFISDAVYDGNLKNNPQTEHQTLIFDDEAKQLFSKDAGIIFMPIEHQLRSQSSIEEAELVAKLYKILLNQSFKDKSNEIYKISYENILIVTPYNLQVNLLKRYLPTEAKVGTVDKFQGQEAEIVIISMVTSDSSLTNDFEFLYSKNRLNVAISRARSLAILIANPDLMLANCESPEDISLVNTLCWLSK